MKRFPGRKKLVKFTSTNEDCLDTNSSSNNLDISCMENKTDFSDSEEAEDEEINAEKKPPPKNKNGKQWIVLQKIKKKSPYESKFCQIQLCNKNREIYTSNVCNKYVCGKCSSKITCTCKICAS